MSNERKIVFYTCWAHFLFHCFEVAFPALAIPLTLSLDMDLAAVLALGFPMYLLFGLCSLPWGVAADRFGNRRILVLALFGAAAGALWTALADSPVTIAASLAESRREPGPQRLAEGVQGSVAAGPDFFFLAVDQEHRLHGGV